MATKKKVVEEPKTSNFRVSIAVNVPMNYEWRGEATSMEHALDQAMEEFEAGDMTNVDEGSAQWDEVELSIGEDEPSVKSPGIYIAELDEDDEEISTN